MSERFEGIAFATTHDFTNDHRPGWVHLQQHNAGYVDRATYFIRTPGGDVGQLHKSTHKVTEHENGTITVEPTLVMPRGWFGSLSEGIFEVVEWGALLPGRIRPSVPVDALAGAV